MTDRGRAAAEKDATPTDPTRPGPARPGTTGLQTHRLGPTHPETDTPLPGTTGLAEAALRPRPLPRADGKLNGNPTPDPWALRRIATPTSARLDPADREWLRVTGISVGEAVRAFVAAHRGDAEVAQARERERLAEQKLAALVAARKVAEAKVGSRKADVATEEARTAERRLAIDRLRVHFQVYVSRVPDESGRLHWVEGRIESIPALRREDPRTVLAELYEGAGP